MQHQQETLHRRLTPQTSKTASAANSDVLIYRAGSLSCSVELKQQRSFAAKALWSRAKLRVYVEIEVAKRAREKAMKKQSGSSVSTL